MTDLAALRAGLRERAAATGLARHAATITALAEPCVRLNARRRADGSIPVGASKLGGVADLPRDVPWPRADGRALPFLCQLDLAAVARALPDGGLPAAGLLSFFYRPALPPRDDAPARAERWHVQWSPPTAATLRRGAGAAALFVAGVLERLAGGRAEPGEYSACGVTPLLGLSLPPAYDPRVLELGADRDEEDAYAELASSLSYEHGAAHQVLGSPDFFQHDPREPASWFPRVDTAGDTGEWVLLLTLDSDEEAGMTWGDDGRLHFVISAADLGAARFDRVRVVFDSP